MPTRSLGPALAWAVLLAGIPAAAADTRLAVLPTQFEESARGLVPRLFDDYLLTAVQNVSGAEVIGQDDINALLGFDKQKSLLGCDDMSCMADIGGALGVDKLVVVKIARLDPEWVATAKLINIREARVESRASEFVSGDVKALLQAVPAVINPLFGAATAAAQAPLLEPEPERPRSSTAALDPPAQSPTQLYAAPALQPNPRLGRGSRVVGIILTSVGLAGMALSSLAMATKVDNSCYDPYGSDLYDDSYGYDDYYTASCDKVDGGVAVAGAVGSVAGLALAGWGTGLYVNGRARAASGDGDATGRVWYRWMGWALMGVAGAWPILTMSAEVPALVWSGALIANAGSALVFVLSMRSSSAYAVTSSGGSLPVVGVQLLRRRDRTVPTAALTFSF